MQQLNLHTSHIPATEKIATAEVYAGHMTTLKIDIGEVRVVLFLPPAALADARAAAAALNVVLQVPYPPRAEDEEEAA